MLKMKRLTGIGLVIGAILLAGLPAYAPLLPDFGPIYQPEYSVGQLPQARPSEHAPSGEAFWIVASRDPVAAFTGVLAIFSGCLVFVAAFQAWLLLRAESVSTISARAAVDAAETGKRALIAGQRAFVSVGFQHNANRDVRTGEITHWMFTPVWRNAGNTPTRRMINHTNVMLSKEPLNVAEFDFPDYWPDNFTAAERAPAPLGAGPHSTVDGQRAHVNREDIQAVIDGTDFLYLWGWVTYNDVFPDTQLYVTRFAVNVVVGGDAGKSDRISFSYQHLQRYNCSDEECDAQGFSATWMPDQRTELIGA